LLISRRSRACHAPAAELIAAGFFESDYDKFQIVKATFDRFTAAVRQEWLIY
jgi:hypothetical protein